MTAYSGRAEIKQLAHLKKKYRGKNDNGGRKCVFAQSPEYKKRSGISDSKDRITGEVVTRHWPSGITKLAAPWFGWGGA